MRKDIPLAHIRIDETDRTTILPIETDPKLYPFEMQFKQNTQTLLAVFEERVTPKSRQGLTEALRKAGFSRYSIAAILKASNGRDNADPFWIRFDDGPQTWKEVWAAIGVDRE